MNTLEVARDLLFNVLVFFAFATAVLTLALADVGMTVLLLKWSGKIKKASELSQPESSLPELPPDHKVVVIGGRIRKWD